MNKTGIILMVSGEMLIASALFLTCYNVSVDKNAENTSNEVLQLIEEKIQTEVSNVKGDNYIALNQDTNHYVSDVEMEEITINNNSYIGIIDIPVLNLKLPVMSELSYENLKVSPCRYYGNIDENSLIIAAHNYSSHFGNIKKLIQGDELYFIDVYGIVHKYIVSELDKIGRNNATEMKNGMWDLTLFTCNFNGTERVTVRCEKKDNEKFFYSNSQ